MLKLLSNRATHATAVAVAVALLLTACISPQTSGASGTPADTHLYTGELPPPAPLPPAAELPPLPHRPADASDATAMAAYNSGLDAYSTAYQKQQAIAEAHQKAVGELAATAAKGGKDAVAAWESLLVVAGIAVAGPDGTPVSLDGVTGSGWPLSDAELRLHSALAADPGGFMLTDLAHVLDAAFGMGDAELTQQLYTELQGIPDHGFWEVFWAVGPSLTDEHGLVAADHVFLDFAQVEVLLRRLATEAVVTGFELDPDAVTASFTHGAASAGVQLASVRSPHEATATKRPCELSGNPWGQQILNQFMKSHAKFIFDEGLKYLAKAGIMSSAGEWVSGARIFSTYASLLAKFASITASYSLDNAPLVRTKDTHPGEVRDLHITYGFDAQNWEKVRECLNLFLAPAGIEIPGSQAGAPSGIDVELFSDNTDEVLVGGGTGSTTVNSAETDGDGKVTFQLTGAAQTEPVPKQAVADDLTVGVYARNDLKGSDLLNDLGSIPWDAADLYENLGLTLLPELISRGKNITTYGEIAVRDWKLDADFEVTAIGTLEARSAYNIDWACSDLPGKNQSTLEKGTLTADPVEVTALLISNDAGNLGDQAFVFVPRGQDEFTMREVAQSGVGMFPLPVHYTIEKSVATPGTAPMPDHVTNSDACNGVGNGGSSSDHTPPAQDCGVREYDSTLQVTIPEPRTLFAAGQPVGGQLWKHCDDPVQPNEPVVAAQYEVCYGTPTITGGTLPSIADIGDPSVRHFQVEGSFNCSDEGPGELHSLDYSWTLDFCRLTDGKPDC